MVAICVADEVPDTDETKPIVGVPIVVTTYGQSPGALMFRLVCTRAQIPCDQDDLLTAEVLKQKFEAGEGYRTLVITTGTSLKGMGAAGIDMAFESQRIAALIAEARRQEMTVIGAHIEGMARRVDATDARSIDEVMPKSNIMLVIEDSNSDGFFTALSEKTGIPLIVVKQSLEIGPTLKQYIPEE
jgi:flagella basal body P-ring formation protein FlgA